MKNVLLTCPPMIANVDALGDKLKSVGIELTIPNFVQTMSEQELIELTPKFDGWIIGDDPATSRVFQAGAAGRLRAAVKWGIGVDNIDFAGAARVGIPIANTPAVFNEEVADIALGYTIALARQTHLVDRAVRQGEWPKPTGISLRGKQAALIGFGNIGRALARRLKAVGFQINAYDPNFCEDSETKDVVTHKQWPEGIGEADYILLTCALNEHTLHILNSDIFSACKPGVRIVNVSRGALIEESHLLNALDEGIVHSAALDVLECEPPQADASILKLDKCVFGSHNASNTREAVIRASHTAIDTLVGFLSESSQAA